MAYDGAGNRVALAVNGGTPTYYLGSLEEISGSTVTKYFNPSAVGSALPTAERAGTGGSLAYLADEELGSVDAALDGNGNVTYQALYLPFGTPRYSSGTSPTDKAFTGQKSDSASGLDYYNARYYDPTGRQFVSADTVRDGQNAYAYVHDDPCTDTDPTGNSSRTPCGGKELIANVALTIASFFGPWNGYKMPTDPGPAIVRPAQSHLPNPGGNSQAQQNSRLSAQANDDPRGTIPTSDETTTENGGVQQTSAGGSDCNDDENSGGGGGGGRGSGGAYGGSVRGGINPAYNRTGGRMGRPQVGVNGKEYRLVTATQVAILRAEQMMSQISEWYMFAFMCAQRGGCESNANIQQPANLTLCIWLICINPIKVVAAQAARATQPSPEPVPVDTVPDVAPVGAGGLDGMYAY